MFVGLEIGVAGFVIVGHDAVGLAMEGTVGFVAKAGVFQRVDMGLGAVGRGTGGEDHVIALASEALIEEGGK